MSSSELNLKSLLIPLEEIQLATDNFHSEVKIQYFFIKPKYKVYGGQLSECWQNRTAAIKRFHAAGVVGEEFNLMRKMFLKEIEMASRFHNESIIPFIGHYDDGNDMILVYEYAIYGSLDHFLADTNNRVIHKQVNSRNIWLNDNMEARISGFTWSKFVPKTESLVYDGVVGNGSYADPVYLESGIVKTEMDVYSLGVVMFEMLTRMLVHDARSIGDVKPQMMIHLVRRYYDVGLDNIIDLHIIDQIDRLSVHMVKEIAFRCISFNVKERPPMSNIIKTITEALDIHVSLFIQLFPSKSFIHKKKVLE